jgi:hypothetical protein
MTHLQLDSEINNLEGKLPYLGKQMVVEESL